MTTIIAEYIWIGGVSTTDIRSKIRIMHNMPSKLSLDLFPEWNFDGSSTYQSFGDNTEVILKPIRIYTNLTEKVFVLCDTYYTEELNNSFTEYVPTINNHRFIADGYFSRDKRINKDIIVGFEQEYILFDGIRPLGWPIENTVYRNNHGELSLGEPVPQGSYYCGNGADVSVGRDIMNEHLETCLDYGIHICGTNSEVLLGQWEFQIGAIEPIQCSDDLVMARFFLNRIAESKNIIVSYDPKPIRGDWNGSGCHINISDINMRIDYRYIEQAIENLASRHIDTVCHYGRGNHLRLTGKHETSSISEFSCGIGTRNTSIRIPNKTYTNKGGYFEDRRPASNIDPYEAVYRLVLNMYD